MEWRYFWLIHTAPYFSGCRQIDPRQLNIDNEVKDWSFNVFSRKGKKNWSELDQLILVLILNVKITIYFCLFLNSLSEPIIIKNQFHDYVRLSIICIGHSFRVLTMNDSTSNTLLIKAFNTFFSVCISVSALNWEIVSNRSCRVCTRAYNTIRCTIWYWSINVYINDINYLKYVRKYIKTNPHILISS